MSDRGKQSQFINEPVDEVDVSMEFDGTMEPAWDLAHKPRLKTEVLTVRLDPSDMTKLKVLSERIGIGHSTLARMMIRRALLEEDLEAEEAATAEVRAGRFAPAG